MTTPWTLEVALKSPGKHSDDHVMDQEMGVVPKTPVTVLQEFVSRMGSAPKYELVQIEGAIHEPTFRYRVAFGQTIASGTGRSKKEAKQAAAKNILEKLTGQTQGGLAHGNEVPEPAKQVQQAGDDNIPGNPIGTLQEMCMARRWPPPTYEMTGEEGPPHEKQFTIACVLGEQREIGTGKSKKLAKRQAANKMWEKLQESSSNGSPSPYFKTEAGSRGESATSHYGYLKSSHIANLGTPHSHKVSTFHRNLKQSTGAKLDALQSCVSWAHDFDSVKFLEEIAAEQQFEVTFMDIEEKSCLGWCQCLVQLSTFPVAVCYGAGATAEDAQAWAAFNALEYLRIMTKK